MQFSQIRTLVRSLTDETTETPVLTNDEIDRLINVRYFNVSAKIIEIHASYFGTTDSTIDLVANQEAYALPDLDSNSQNRVEHILHVKVAYNGSNFYRARPIQPIEIVDTNFQNISYTQNSPVYYLLGNNIHILPNPTANATNAVKIWYNQRPAELSSDADVPQFSPLYHDILAYGAAADVKRKDGDVSDFALLQDFEDKFQRGLASMIESIQPRDSSYPSQVIDVDSVYTYPQELYVPPSSMTL